jgi:hypothetical protein
MPAGPTRPAEPVPRSGPVPPVGQVPPSGPMQPVPSTMPAMPPTVPVSPGMPAASLTGPTMPGASLDSPSAPPEPGGPEPEPGSEPSSPVGSVGDGSVGSPSTDQEADWLDRICPYLLSRDGTHRSSQPDIDHRCTAVDPPSSLPVAFQERFCLSERHVRCEMYKVAQSARSAALDQQGIPADQVRTARFKPSVRSVPLALGPASGASPTSETGSRRPLVIGLVAVGILVVGLILVAMLLGGGGKPAPDASPTPIAVGSASPPASPVDRPSVAPSQPAVSRAPSAVPASGRPDAGGTRIEYEVQEGEALIAIAERFGTSRRDILRANPDLAGKKPYTQPGDVIIVPVSASLAASAKDVPGFVRYVE